MRPTPKTFLLALPILAVSLTLAACGGSSSSYPSSSSNAGATSSAASTTAAPSGSASASTGGVRTASNATLGATVLVDAQGMTLYHLSGEQDGRFLCTSAACVAAWPPLSASAIDTGVSGLAAIKRPDGSAQLAYEGEPLYTFTGDKAAGEANGQGIKADGGTWSAVVAGAGSASAAQTSGAAGEGAAASSGGETGGSSSGSGGGGGYKY